MFRKLKFPEIPHPKALTGLLLVLFYLAATWVKAPPIFQKPRFWAEEGIVYFMQGRALSFLETAVAMPLGYLSFPANLAGWVSAQLPFYHAPLGGLLVSLAVQLTIVCVVMVNRFFDGHRLQQALFLLVPLLVFQSFETWLNSINSQFWMMLAAALVLAAPQASGKFAVVSCNTCITLLAGFSSPGSAFLAPLFVGRAVLEKKIQWLVYGLAASAGAVVMLALQQQSRGIAFPIDIFGVFASTHLLLNNLCMRCAHDLYPVLVQHEALRWALAALVAGLYIFFWLRADRLGRWLLTASFAIALLSFASMLGKDMVLNNSPFFNARYFFAPASLFFGALLASALRGRLLEKMVVGVFAISGIFSSIKYPPVGIHFGETWQQSTQEFLNRESDVIYFARDLCGFAPATNLAQKNIHIRQWTPQTLELAVTSPVAEGEKLFFYKQAMQTYTWEVGAPQWRPTPIFLIGTERFGYCYGGDIPTYDAQLQVHGGKISIPSHLLGSLEGHFFLVGFGKNFAAMLAKNDFLLIDGNVLRKSQP